MHLMQLAPAWPLCTPFHSRAVGPDVCCGLSLGIECHTLRSMSLRKRKAPHNFTVLSATRVETSPQEQTALSAEALASRYRLDRPLLTSDGPQTGMPFAWSPPVIDSKGEGIVARPFQLCRREHGLFIGV